MTIYCTTKEFRTFKNLIPQEKVSLNSNIYCREYLNIII
jgi:hypothetical protein